MAEPEQASPLPPTSSAAIAAGVLDADLAALVWLLAGGGVPLVVASPSADDARRLRDLLVSGVDAGQTPTAGGVVVADSFAGVLRRSGGSADSEVLDEQRGLGLVVVLRRVPAFGPRIVSAHYLRPIERDGAGHLQRRPPALLAAWHEDSDSFDHFWWGFADELARRVERPLADFSADQRRRRDLLAGLARRKPD
jgi:hypothetical protein